MDRVTLRGLSVRGHHGVFRHERDNGQTFVVDLVLGLDTTAAAAGDDLGRTVHYGVVAEEVAAVVAGEPVDLIETLAQRIADTCLGHEMVEEVEVTVHKPGAPISVPFDDVTVTITPEAPVSAESPEFAPFPDESRQPAVDPTVQPVPAAVVAAVDAADSTLQNPRTAVIALGSNLGNRLETLQGAVDALEDTPGLRVRSVSPVYETEPWGVQPGTQASYFNAVVLIRTTLPPAALLERGHAIEEAFRRVRAERWGPRTIDVDIVVYQGVVSNDPVLTLPHPHAHERAFVLVPWYDVDPAAVLPGRGPVADLVTAVGNQGVARRADMELRLPE